TPKKYAAVTLHRPSNVDDPKVLGGILSAFEQIARKLTIVFPMHPRTRKNLATMGLEERSARIDGFLTPEPLGYLDFLKLMADAAIVLTDSGGVQEETTILGVPCLTLRENTERPSTISDGTNRLIGPSTDAILKGFAEQMAATNAINRKPPLWDGKSAER